jgi:hypothetical protein
MPTPFAANALKPFAIAIVSDRKTPANGMLSSRNGASENGEQ